MTTIITGAIGGGSAVVTTVLQAIQASGGIETEGGANYFEIIQALGGIILASGAYVPVIPDIVYDQSFSEPIYVEQDEQGNWIPSEWTFENPFVTILSDYVVWNAGWAYYFNDGSGGACSGGTAIVEANYTNVKLSPFGSVAGGTAIVIRKGVIFTMRSNLARCLAGGNVVKTADAAKLVTPGITSNIPATPAIPPGYEFENLPTWCGFQDQCPDGAVLPTITQNNQASYLPPKDRGTTAVADSIASA